MRQVLRHEVDLPRALCLEELRLTNHLVQRKRPVLAAHQWNGAEGASMIAPLAHLEIPDVRSVAGKEPHARMDGGHVVDETARLELRQQPVHLR